MAKNYKPRVALPTMRSDKDSEWIEGILLTLSRLHQDQAREAYSDAYMEAKENETVEHKKENTARKAANTRLRLFRDRCMTVYAKQCERQDSNFEW